MDLDVLDPSVGRANALAVPGGLTAGGVCAVARAAAAARPLGAAALTAYDPSCDGAGGVLAAALAIAEGVVRAAEAGAR